MPAVSGLTDQTDPGMNRQENETAGYEATRMINGNGVVNANGINKMNLENSNHYTKTKGLQNQPKNRLSLLKECRVAPINSLANYSQINAGPLSQDLKIDTASNVTDRSRYLKTNNDTRPSEPKLISNKKYDSNSAISSEAGFRNMTALSVIEADYVRDVINLNRFPKRHCEEHYEEHWEVGASGQSDHRSTMTTLNAMGNVNTYLCPYGVTNKMYSEKQTVNKDMPGENQVFVSQPETIIRSEDSALSISVLENFSSGSRSNCDVEAETSMSDFIRNNMRILDQVLKHTYSINDNQGSSFISNPENHQEEQNGTESLAITEEAEESLLPGVKNDCETCAESADSASSFIAIGTEYRRNSYNVNEPMKSKTEVCAAYVDTNCCMVSQDSENSHDQAEVANSDTNEAFT